MDETGFSIGAIKGAQVVMDTTLLTKYQAHPGRQESVTVLACVSADDQSISPFIILKGKNLSMHGSLKMHWKRICISDVVHRVGLIMIWVYIG